MKKEIVLNRSSLGKSIAPITYVTFRDSKSMLASRVVLLLSKGQFDLNHIKEVKVTLEIADGTDSSVSA